MNRAERLINKALDGHLDHEELAEIFRHGYPIENFSCFFDSCDYFVLALAIETCYEMGKLAKPYVDRVAEKMNDNSMLKSGEGIVWLADYAEENNILADWMILSCVDDEDFTTSLVAMRILSSISFGQLRGAKKYLLENIPSSPHITAIDNYINYYNDEPTIYKMLGSDNTILQRYAVALASRYFEKNLLLRKKAMLICNDDVIIAFVKEKIERMEFEHSLWRSYPLEFLVQTKRLTK
jgi:hypothetical protein